VKTWIPASAGMTDEQLPQNVTAQLTTSEVAGSRDEATPGRMPHLLKLCGDFRSLCGSTG
ncbi:MAG: hypothetical protein KDH89_03100, partial [Anaerolineae bacterium]|nr:hypothetical protein [Anaerolineae bacterium]